MADDGPKGYVIRGKGLPPGGRQWSCPLCVQRFCICFSAAWEASKRHSLLTGHSVVLETVDGVKLAETRPAGSGGGQTYLPAPKLRAPMVEPDEDDDIEEGELDEQEVETPDGEDEEGETEVDS